MTDDCRLPTADCLALAQGLIRQQSNDSPSHRGNISRGRQEAVPAFLDDLTNTVDVARHGGYSRQKGFDQRSGESFPERGQQKDVKSTQ